MRADEAAASARDEAEEKRQDEYESACRLATLRGLPPPAPLSPPPGPPKRDRDAGNNGKEFNDYRKRRRITGEDDTDRDIRLARQDREKQHESQNREQSKQPKNDGPLTDHAGHIQLFAPPSTKDIRIKRDAEDEHRRREKESAEQHALRFSDANGLKQNIKELPWYAASRGYSGTEELDNKYIHGEGLSSGKDAFGNVDAGRERRDIARIASADPMAMMRKAQTKLKEVERERDGWKKERERELKEIEVMQEKNQRRRKRGGDEFKQPDAGLEGFNLDAATGAKGRSNNEYNHKHINRRRSRSPERARKPEYEKSRRHRSRSVERSGCSSHRPNKTDRPSSYRQEPSTRVW